MKILENIYFDYLNLILYYQIFIHFRFLNKMNFRLVILLITLVFCIDTCAE